MEMVSLKWVHGGMVLDVGCELHDRSSIQFLVSAKYHMMFGKSI